MRIPFIAALAAAALAPSVASAQSYHEVRRDRQELRHDRRDVRDARRHGDRQDVRHARREYREDRRETHEDWRDYRRSHRGVYHRSRYVGPRGYSHRSIGVGYRFAPAYYGQRYWINDPYSYRLRRPGAYQRWIRYGNDVVLVNTRTGRAVTVYNSFFW